MPTVLYETTDSYREHAIVVTVEKIDDTVTPYRVEVAVEHECEYLFNGYMSLYCAEIEDIGDDLKRLMNNIKDRIDENMTPIDKIKDEVDSVIQD